MSPFNFCTDFFFDFYLYLYLYLFLFLYSYFHLILSLTLFLFLYPFLSYSLLPSLSFFLSLFSPLFLSLRILESSRNRGCNRSKNFSTCSAELGPSCTSSSCKGEGRRGLEISRGYVLLPYDFYII